MSSLSPDQNDSQPTLSSPDAPPSGDQEKGGLLNLGFFKDLAEKRSTRADGGQPKRRGPKPDSKPALTRRQELNRQAQRTHRERKELYIKALEGEVLRLKEIYSTVSQDKTKLADENKQLKELLAQYGIPFPGMPRDDGGNANNGHPSSTSTSGNSHAVGSHGGFSPGVASQSTAPSISPSAPPQNHQLMSGQNLRSAIQQASSSKGVDYDQAGIDFVLTLERPCMNHMPFLLDRANEPGGDPCGHALMASCPPKPVAELPPHLPFGAANIHDDTGSGQRTWEVTKADLSTLMDLSAKIDLDGEITPVMAWGIIMSHPRFLDLEMSDLQGLTEELGRKVRCYGFGAVTEEFEVRDAIAGVLSKHPEQMVE